MHTPPPTPELTRDPRALAFARLLAVVDALRAPDGCPWDREQTLATMAPHLVEEAHEAVEAVEAGSDAQVAEECGDVLMVVALLCRIAEQQNRFDLAAAAQGIAEKLVRRHPHVFGDVVAEDSGTVLANWEAIKQRERAGRAEDASALAGVPVALPALQRASRVGGKAIAAGFRWESPAGALAKLREELRELEGALAEVDLSQADPARDGLAGASAEQRAAVEHELGDVLIAAAFLGRYLGVDAERACRAAVRRFESRFRATEAMLERPMKEYPLDELLQAWQRAKQAEVH
jgi:MazG family protein